MIVVVLNQVQAQMAEDAGAVAVIPIDGTKLTQDAAEGALRTTDLSTIKKIMSRVLIPVIGRVRVGHLMEAKAMEAAQVTCIDENELLNPIVDKNHDYTTHIMFREGADGANGFVYSVKSTHIPKNPFTIPFICGAADMTEVLQRILEGASMIRTKHAAPDDETHDASKTFETVRKIMKSLDDIINADETRLYTLATSYNVATALLQMIKNERRLPVPFFAAGNIIMPIDVAMLMALGCDGVIVSNRVFNNISPETRLDSIMTAIKKHKDPEELSKIIERSGGYGPKPVATK
ncbi:hypothetical protein IWW36_004617 [Coemansia brasiliensis]|uniref:pyridoxal 5'-phosphate synthase (glutamine hydrolyzing) n=1 Tax=Coemansia brasiliensis TaxID=2650707 RepID=A0A9W8LXV7_9FUNG|nr:hypothetical protein IWW36_004617 [Coemansia brasiliensis]